MVQVKTVAKQRYLKRKARRHKVLAKAKKDSAPKRPVHAAEPVATSSDETESESEEAVSDDSESDGEAAPLAPFPTAIEPARPDPQLLKRQGLPAGLEDARFIPPTRASLAGITDTLQTRLRSIGVQDLFAVQSSLVPRLLSEPFPPRPDYIPNDILVSAPTGSGKTLAYAIPLIQVLSKRRVRRLRGLVIVPTKELVRQVKETLETLAKGALDIASTGNQALAAEQKALVGTIKPLAGGSSNCDVLVATPGRLIEHLESTPNFSLQHLRFLIIDEADRLLAQSFQGWLAQVSSHIQPSPVMSTGIGDDVAAAWRGNPVTCQKLLFSATLTRDPATIATLGLRNPEYYIHGTEDVTEQYALPSTLEQKMTVIASADKPLALLHLIYGQKLHRALVFCKSIDAANRLSHLLKFFSDAWLEDRVSIAAYTAESDKKTLDEFSKGALDILVCSDVIARGLDLTIDTVISYDAPLDMRRYVHRAGRTARAGRAGLVWTLVETQQALHFKQMITAKNVRINDFSHYQESYQIAIKRFQSIYGR